MQIVPSTSKCYYKAHSIFRQQFRPIKIPQFQHARQYLLWTLIRNKTGPFCLSCICVVKDCIVPAALFLLKNPVPGGQRFTWAACWLRWGRNKFNYSWDAHLNRSLSASACLSKSCVNRTLMQQNNYGTHDWRVKTAVECCIKQRVDKCCLLWS